MLGDFHPYSKKTQLGQKDKDTPKIFRKKRYPAKKKSKPKENKNVEMYQDRRIPHWKKRGEFSRATKNEIARIWGEYCYVCGDPNYTHHHVYEKGFGKGGRGVKTNGLPLCLKHHTVSPTGIHHDREFYDRVRAMFIERFGPDYYKDKYDLWMEKKIENPTEELYEKYMEKYR